jgi:uncharacterized membrane protein YhhN
MSPRDLAARLALAAAFVGGASYLAAEALQVGGWAGVAWKGSGVALLAVYAALKARRSLDGWLLAAVMALGAAGDVLIEVAGLTGGALAFLAGHLVAIGLYLRNLRPGLSKTDTLLARALVPVTVVAAWLLPADRGAATGAALYAAGLGAMAATAWLSRFPRGLTGAGALMFVASDLLIFARVGPLAGQGWATPAIWVLYFAGQAMICLGVVRTLSPSARSA